jgi:ribonuclease HIII
MNNEKELQNIANQIKAGIPIEVLDQLEREYNEMYQRLKAKEEELRKAKLTPEEVQSAYSRSIANQDYFGC